ncbi:MAG TPA: TIGR01777 family oxidoreductase [Sandaracinaceae bacterium LLY-WYZ-13_1]|nr:TIGR01777 family oxidoreductase [Sandaracinaceae bacterium LLY-WYZ-13_1]
MTRRTLITGATGFVGPRLVDALRAGGAEATALSRNAVRARQAVPGLREAWDWQGPRDTVPAEALESASAVVHLAGESVSGRWTAAKRHAIEESRVAGTRRLVEAIAAAEPRPSVLVSASAIGYYGDRGEEVLDEDAGSGDDFLAGVCVGWERQARAAEDLGVRVVRLRIGLVLGEGGGALAAMKPLFAAGLGGRLGSGRQWWPWIHVDDLVAMVQRAIADDAWSGAINAVAPEPIRQAGFAEALAAALRRPAFLPAPAFAIRTVLGGFAAELLSSRRVVPARARALGFEHAHADLGPALRDAL